MLSNVRSDIRYALRTLRRNPGFAVAAILPIALGIGINTGIFSILNSVAWRPLPVSEPEALVSIYQDFRGGPRRLVHGARSLFSMSEYRAYRDEARTLSSLMAYSREWTVTLGRDVPQEVDGTLVTCNYFEVLGLSPAIGTGFTSANCGVPGAPAAVVLSYALWKGAFGGDPQVLQKPIVLNGRDVTVVGVGPAGFDGVDMAKTAFFAPTSMAGVLRPEQYLLDENANVSWLTLIGRRRNDAGLAQVRADLSLVAQSHRSAASGAHDVADRRTGRGPVAAGRAAGDSQGSESGHGRVRARAADRRHQRREHPAGPCDGANQGDRDSAVRRRHTRPPHSAIAHRKRHHRGCRCDVRLVALLLGRSRRRFPGCSRRFRAGIPSDSTRRRIARCSGLRSVSPPPPRSCLDWFLRSRPRKATSMR